MKKLILSLGACSLAFAAPVAVPTTAIAQADNSASNLLALCRAAIAEDPTLFKSLGECVSLPAQVCNEVKKAGEFPLDLGGGVILKNQGECVNYVKANIT
jgi:hypothetical protein